jgi:two-component system cell cycle response regulator DivK
MERRRPRQPPARPLVLIVDGHDDATELYAAALASFDFEVGTVDDGERAFDCAWEAHPDIIVTEVSLPRLDVWSLVENLKGNPRTRDIPVVVLTGHAVSSLRERAGRDGCAAVLAKPCLPQQLAHDLRDLLDRLPGTSTSRSTVQGEARR